MITPKVIQPIEIWGQNNQVLSCRQCSPQCACGWESLIDVRWKSQVGSFPPVSHNKNEATFFFSSSRLKWLLIKLVVYQVFKHEICFFCVLHVWVLYLEDVFKLLLDLVAGTTYPQVIFFVVRLIHIPRRGAPKEKHWSLLGTRKNMLPESNWDEKWGPCKV